MRTARCLLHVALLLACSAAQAAFESAPTLDASRLAPPELLNGPLHKVAPQVTVEQYLGRFEIRSDLGTFPATGVEMLRARVNELRAIAALNEVNQSKAFQEALAKSAMAPVDFAKNLATDPQKTAANVANGVGGMFASAGRAIQKGAKSVSNTASGNKSATPGDGAPSKFTDDPLGYNKAKREWARKLEVDPYSSNPVLQEKLAAVAQATFAGNFAVGFAVGAVAAPLQYASDFDKATRDSVWDSSPGDLEARNEAKLKEMGVDAKGIDALLANTWFTPSLQTVLVTALDALRGAKGRGRIVDVAATVSSETQARFLIDAVRMLALYGKRGDPVVDVRVTGRVPFGMTRGGTLVVAAPLDYVSWTEQVAGFTTRKELAARKHVLLLSGQASPTAQGEFAKAAWTVEENYSPHQ